MSLNKLSVRYYDILKDGYQMLVDKDNVVFLETNLTSDGSGLGTSVGTITIPRKVADQFAYLLMNMIEISEMKEG